jgi:6-phosphogluconolactonase (cycloisomerase 2 family)
MRSLSTFIFVRGARGLSPRISGLLLSIVFSFAALIPPDVAAAERTFYVVNSGGTISTFAIQPNRALAASGGISGVGTFLRGIAIAPDGKSAYVLDSANATVLAFDINTDGVLMPIGSPVATDPNARGPFASCLPEESNASGAGPCPWNLALAPNGRWLYVTNRDSHTISVFSVLPDRTLRLLGPPLPTGGIAPRGLAVSPDGEMVYVALRETDAIAAFAVSRTGALHPRGTPVRVPGCTPSAGATPVPECSPFFVSITPDGRWLYAANQDSGDLATFAIGPNGTLTPVEGRAAIGGRPEGIVISIDGRFLYSISVDANAVFAFAIAADGRLTSLGSLPTCDQAETAAACGPNAIGITPDSRAVYALNTFSENIASFGVNDDGTLVEIEPSPIPTGGVGPAIEGVVAEPNQGPIASLARHNVASHAASFDASESSDLDGEIVRYDWDFGDGETVSNAGPNTTHVYAKPGRYRVTVTVSDNEGCSDALVFTGQTVLCNGSADAKASRVITVGGGS